MVERAFFFIILFYYLKFYYIFSHSSSPFFFLLASLAFLFFFFLYAAIIMLLLGIMYCPMMIDCAIVTFVIVVTGCATGGNLPRFSGLQGAFTGKRSEGTTSLANRLLALHRIILHRLSWGVARRRILRRPRRWCETSKVS